MLGVEWIFILPVALVAGTIGGLIGFGAGIIMVPILVWVFGAKAAVPIMAIAALLANASRVWVWWREVDWRAAGVYAAAAVPFTLVGASTYVVIDARTIETTLGAFLLVLVPVRRWLAARHWQLKRWHLAIVGAAIGLLTGLVAATGPINAPFFLMYGLTKGAYIATEAMASIAVHTTKTAVFSAAGLTDIDNLFRGLAVGTGLMAGSLLSKRLLLRIQPAQFHMLMDVVIVLAGLGMLLTAHRTLLFNA
jgi:uncharacterized membrane protein YfcA